MIIPAAHPTPAVTETALAGQLRSHAPHSMQASRSVMRAFLSSIEKTACGQTSVHLPHPMHFSGSFRSVTTSGIYLKADIVVSFLSPKTGLLDESPSQP
jgi:hypothetical protein